MKNARSEAIGNADPRARMLEGLPITERVIRLAGIRTVVLEAGEGRPVVLLHGGIECGGPVWAPVIRDLAERHRVIVPDIPGFGVSDPAETDLYAVLHEWFGDLVRRTCDEPPALVAHSLGGSLAAGLAARDESLLSRLVVYGAPGVGPYRLPLGLRVMAIRFGLRPTQRNSERFARWAFHDYDGFKARSPEWLAAFGEEGRIRARVPHVKQAMRGLIARGTVRIPDAELRRIALPVDLVWGRHDRFVALELARGAGERLGWPVHVIDQAGHVPHIERPTSFLKALDEVLNVPAGAAAA